MPLNCFIEKIKNPEEVLNPEEALLADNKPLDATDSIETTGPSSEIPNP